MKLLLIGLIFLSVSFVPSEAYLSIPPTKAFSMINGSGGNITASSYADYGTFVAGTGVTISFDYLLKTITFNATSGSSPNQSYCDSGKWFDAFNSTTNDFRCTTVPAGSAYENNTMSSPTHANSLVLTKSGVDLPVKGIACSGSAVCSNNSTDVTISVTGLGSGNATSLDDLGDVIISGPTYPSMLFYNSTQWVNRIFSINNQSVTSGFLVSGINNQTGVFSTATIKNPLLDGSNHTDTEADAVTRGDIIVGTSATLWGELPIGASGTVLKSDGTDPSWGTVATPTVLAANVTTTSFNDFTQVWTIPLTANSGNQISGVLIASSNTANAAVQASANVTNANSAGWCVWQTPTSATALTIDFLLLSTGVPAETGETTWIAGANIAQPILFDCSIQSGPTAGNLRLYIQAEVASTVSAKAGSYYIKTP